MVHLAPAADQTPGSSLVVDPVVLGALAEGFGPGGIGVVTHDAKDLIRSLLPLDVDITSATSRVHARCMSSSAGSSHSDRTWKLHCASRKPSGEWSSPKSA